MGKSIQALYERGVFRPLQPVELEDGRRVTLSVEPGPLSAQEAKCYLSRWREVYEGLSEADIAEVEAIATDRSHFMDSRAEPH